MANGQARFLMVSFTWRGLLKAKELEPVFNLALDWLRYAPNCWILWTNTDIATWNERVKAHMAPEDSVLIVEINLSTTPDTYSGFHEKWIWDWVQKAR